MAAKLTSAQRAARRDEKRRLRNRAVKSVTKTYLDNARGALQGKDLAAAEKAVLQAVTALDKAAHKGVAHGHNVARRKSRLMKRLNAFKATATQAT